MTQLTTCGALYEIRIFVERALFGDVSDTFKWLRLESTFFTCVMMWHSKKGNKAARQVGKTAKSKSKWRISKQRQRAEGNGQQQESKLPIADFQLPNCRHRGADYGDFGGVQI